MFSKKKKQENHTLLNNVMHVKKKPKENSKMAIMFSKKPQNALLVKDY